MKTNLLKVICDYIIKLFLFTCIVGLVLKGGIINESQIVIICITGGIIITLSVLD